MGISICFYFLRLLWVDSWVRLKNITQAHLRVAPRCILIQQNLYLRINLIFFRSVFNDNFQINFRIVLTVNFNLFKWVLWVLTFQDPNIKCNGWSNLWNHEYAPLNLAEYFYSKCWKIRIGVLERCWSTFTETLWHIHFT